MEQENKNPMEQGSFSNLPPLNDEQSFPPVEELDIDDLLGPELMAMLGRSPAQPKEAPAPEPLPPEPAPIAEAMPELPCDEPAPASSAEPTEPLASEHTWTPPVRRRPRQDQRRRKGTMVFYTVYTCAVIIIIAALLAVTIPLHNWLVRYEASQPGQHSEVVFSEIFADPDWAVIYDLAEVRDTTFEGKDAFVKYMQAKVSAAANPKLTYAETSAGLSGDRKYIVKLDEEKIATFTLASSTDEKENLTTWKLGVVEVFFQRSESICVEKLPEHTVFINGVPLDSSYTIRSISTRVEEYLPSGVHGYQLQTQQVTGLLSHPASVYVVDAGGNDIPTVFDPETNTYKLQLPVPEEMTEQERQLALNAAKANALFAIRAISTGELRKYYDTTSQIYKDIIETPIFGNNYASYAFDESVTSVSDYYRYSDSLFSARVTLKMDVTRKDGTIKTLNMDTTYFLSKTASGSYLVNQITNVPVHERQEKVRFTFFSGEEQVASMFISTDDETVTLPAVELPEGQILRGWAQQVTDESGNVTMTILFAPDESGVAAIPADLVLEPMNLYAVFEAKGADAQ